MPSFCGVGGVGASNGHPLVGQMQKDAPTVMNLKAIQTFYKGYHFRSRLEARWAVFLDALGLKWEYEPEGFELPGGVWYLPDFRTTSPTGLVNWYEVKPSGVTSDPKVTVANRPIVDLFGLGDEPGMGVIILSGDPLEHICFDDVFDESRYLDGVRVCPRCGVLEEAQYGIYDMGSDGIHFGCQQCDFDTPCGSGNPKEKGVLTKVEPYKGSLIVKRAAFSLYLRKVHTAATMARRARFEHGQSGANK